VAGVALATAISDFVRHDRRLSLKWPNDLLFARAKLAGVLLEGVRAGAGRFACVIGFGVNCVSHPTGLTYPATDLSVIARPTDPIDVLERLSARMAEWLEIWDLGRGFQRVRETWLHFATGIGERIVVRTIQERREGVFQGLDEDGRLLLATEDGVLTIEAGDVFLAPELEGDAHRNKAR
jgi:BirA family transcriptional regulator, biotin operon repressor / biotin---[acetyl-CoA-carboxylase] ligase